jgi:hypothetical protein
VAWSGRQHYRRLGCGSMEVSMKLVVEKNPIKRDIYDVVVILAIASWIAWAWVKVIVGAA